MLALLFLLCAPAFASIADQIGSLAICVQGCITSAIFQCGCSAADFTCACQCPTLKPFASACFDTSCAANRVSTALDNISSICAVVDPQVTTTSSLAMISSSTTSSLSAASLTSTSTSTASSSPLYPPCTAQPTQSGSFIVCANSSWPNITGTPCLSGPNQSCLPSPIQFSSGTNFVLMGSVGFYFLTLCHFFL